MFGLWFWIYNVFIIPILSVVVRFAALFNKKIASGLKGRQNLFSSLESQVKALNPEKPRIWIHISSMGEFEQAKPIVNTLKARNPAAQVILSFFSPSGYDNSSSFTEADIRTYLPFDSYWQVKKFVRILRPDVAVVVRHDIWPNMLWRLQKEGIPSLLVDASISDKRLRTLALFPFFYRILYSPFTEILTVSELQIKRIEKVYPFPRRLHVSGDTRYDQVLARCREMNKIDFLIKSGIFHRDRCFVAGSTWPGDEKIVLPPVAELLKSYKDFIFIIAPHEPTREHLENVEEFFRTHSIRVNRLSEFERNADKDFQVLLIDRIGLLANLYALGLLAYVGGGFGPGVHSVLEPAAHGCAVIFGPRHSNSIEAHILITSGGGKYITSAEQAKKYIMQLLNNPSVVMRMGEKARKLVNENAGASERVVTTIEKYMQHKLESKQK